MLRIPTLVLFVVALVTGATAAEIKAFCSAPLRPAMSELVREFEQASGDKVTIQYGIAAALADRIQKGESADIAILPPPQIQNLANQGMIAEDSKVNVG
jgi:molybdate transport system substrate-binding protein